LHDFKFLVNSNGVCCILWWLLVRSLDELCISYKEHLIGSKGWITIDCVIWVARTTQALQANFVVKLWSPKEFDSSNLCIKWVPSLYFLIAHLVREPSIQEETSSQLTKRNTKSSKKEYHTWNMQVLFNCLWFLMRQYCNQQKR